MGLWTKEHFYTIVPAFIAFIVIAVILGKLMKGKSEKVRYLPLQIITIILLALEFMKQGYNMKGGYDLYALPFHYCSLFLYLLPLHSFYRGRHKKTVDALTLACTSSLFLFMLIMPAVVYGDWNIKNYFNYFSDFHTVTFHNLVCLYFLLMLAFKLYDFNVKKDLIATTIFLALYVIIALILAFMLDTNYQNLLKCNLPMVEDVRLAMVSAIGFIGHLIYVFVLFILTILFAYASYFSTKGILKLISKIDTKKKSD